MVQKQLMFLSRFWLSGAVASVSGGTQSQSDTPGLMTQVRRSEKGLFISRGTRVSGYLSVVPPGLQCLPGWVTLPGTVAA